VPRLTRSAVPRSGVRSDDRANIRNGYRRREWDTRAGSIELAIPKLRQGSYFPDWLLERRRRAEAALVTVVATSYLLGSRPGGWKSWSPRWASTG
jgi:transposase-like protein